MKSFTLAFFAVALACAQAGVISHAVLGPVVTGTTLQGPSTRSAVVGPDGSSIVAAAPGGVVTTSVDAGYAAHGFAPAVVAAGYAAPVVSAYSAPVVANHGIYAAAPAVVAARGIVAPYGYAGVGLYPEGSGIRGQYVHDYTETLYDDGSYKGEIYP